MLKIAGSQFAKNFGHYARSAQRETVEVTAYGRPYVFVLPPQEYERLRRLDRQVMATTELPREIRQAIAKAKPSKAAAKFNHEAKA